MSNDQKALAHVDAALKALTAALVLMGFFEETNDLQTARSICIRRVADAERAARVTA